MCAEATKDDVQIDFKKKTKEDIEICQNTLNLNFCFNLRDGIGSLVYQPAHQHVLAVPLTYFTDTYHLTEIFTKNLK